MVRPGPDSRAHRRGFAGELTWSETAGEAERLGAAVDKLIAGRTVYAEPVHRFALLEVLLRPAGYSWGFG